ncbi:DNA-binding protein WhiA [Denitrobacterium detoxificans]|uniref:DNA-binding protein WhiA n=1 Tax=Denitrobacterium detoxificans TaxID=79604 RepID=UPI0026EBE8C5|nr:DNA-binding protein WhiA [Denitrobacterium detoxificans]MBE6465180.1 DNA-binding protein WhiA [Denitrobacterium detoxificans]
MSFTADVKEELSRVPPVCSHCERATLAALIRMEGSLFLAGSGRFRIEVDTDSPSVARLLVKLLHEQYGLKTDWTVRRSVLHKTPNYLIEVPMQKGLPEAMKDMGVLTSGGFDRGVYPKLVEKRCCAAAYLRGAFLGSGFIANPKGDFHFEMSVESEELANGLVELMAERDISAKIMQRRSNYIVYMKSGSAISAFLAVVGAHQSALAMENVRVIKSVRNDVNRRVNAELANQQKATEASMEQIMAIHAVIDRYGLESLPPALQEFIKLRVSHPDATLKELGEYADPPLSKSAVYHRVRRIEQLAAQVER